jgi:hypothetical protein
MCDDNSSAMHIIPVHSCKANVERCMGVVIADVWGHELAGQLLLRYNATLPFSTTLWSAKGLCLAVVHATCVVCAPCLMNSHSNTRPNESPAPPLLAPLAPTSKKSLLLGMPSARMPLLWRHSLK